jgi:hypothetical protein
VQVARPVSFCGRYLKYRQGRIAGNGSRWRWAVRGPSFGINGHCAIVDLVIGLLLEGTSRPWADTVCFGRPHALLAVDGRGKAILTPLRLSVWRWKLRVSSLGSARALTVAWKVERGEWRVESGEWKRGRLPLWEGELNVEGARGTWNGVVTQGRAVWRTKYLSSRKSMRSSPVIIAAPKRSH